MNALLLVAKLIKKYWVVILFVILYGIVGRMDFDDEVCKYKTTYEECQAALAEYGH